MLTQNQLDEIKNLLEKAQNPLFFFDNDVDGLCAFLILQRAIGRGKGVPARSFPDLNASYLRKVEEFNPDYIFILDKPKVSKEFIDGVIEKNIGIAWIDHHGVENDSELLGKVNYFNSFPSSEPTTYLCYKAAGKKEDAWIGMIGCVGDVYKPDFAKEFAKEYPELFDYNVEAFDSLFTTEVGKAVKILNSGLKDSTTNTIKLIKYLISAKNIYDILIENKFTKQLHFRYKHLSDTFDKLIKKATLNSEINTKKLLFFSYGGEMSVSSEISNELYFKNKGKLVCAAYRGAGKINISIRGRNAKKITEKLVSEIGGSLGGGHDEATGIQIPFEKLEDFKKKLVELVEIV